MDYPPQQFPPQLPPQHTFYPDWQGRRATKSIFSAVAGGLWLIALALPAYTDDVPGLGALIFGWMLAFDGESLGFVGWMANAPFVVAIFMFMIGRRPSIIRAALILSIIAAVFSLGAFTVDEVPNYGGTTNVSPYIGCYTWVFSVLVLMVGVIVYYVQQNAFTKGMRTD
jgi:hypothetical protein